jgi:hypothetical protein
MLDVETASAERNAGMTMRLPAAHGIRLLLIFIESSLFRLCGPESTP